MAGLGFIGSSLSPEDEDMNISQLINAVVPCQH